MSVEEALVGVDSGTGGEMSSGSLFNSRPLGVWDFGMHRFVEVAEPRLAVWILA